MPQPSPPLKWLCTILALSVNAYAEPLLSTWFTDRSGNYAKLYETDADQTALNAVSTWNRGDGNQEEPTYAGIHEIAYTDDWVYCRTTNLASYIMGPWYLSANRNFLFPNYPANQASIFRIPRNPTDLNTVNNKTETGGSIGYMVNGVSMFDTRDAFSYSTSSGDDVQGNGGEFTWNRDAYVNEGATFDAANAHQANATYHYHANPSALRHQLGDSVDYDPTTNTYTENFNGNHSPIIAWAFDGLPVYGPYAYSAPEDPNSQIRRMVSGFQLRTDISADGSARNSWPAWATRIYAIVGRTFIAGPTVSSTFPLGRYLEDNDYKADLNGFTQYTSAGASQIAFDESIHYDLNEYNVRWCVTPEFPNGTWAYFTCILNDGTPTFPYNIVRTFFGDPVGGEITSIPESSNTNSDLVTYFEGGPEKEESIEQISINTPAANQITLTWSAIEGGSYKVSETTDLDLEFTTIDREFIATNDRIETTYSPNGGNIPEASFYKISRSQLESFDDAGFEYTKQVPAINQAATITVSMSGGPADLTSLPTLLTFNGQIIDVSAANVTRSNRQSLTFDVYLYGLNLGNYTVAAQYSIGPLRTALIPYIPISS